MVDLTFACKLDKMRQLFVYMLSRNLIIFIPLLVILVVGAVVLGTMNSVSSPQLPSDLEGQITPNSQTNAATDGSQPMPDQRTALAGKYVDYDQTLLADAEGGQVVLFFWAGWCPTCQALERNLIAELDQIPAGLTILRANYDTEEDLKRKYGVTYQHTLVQVDAAGNLLQKWSGSYSLSDIVNQLI